MLHLASKSLRRRELLARVGVAFTPLDVDIPEQRAAGEPAHAYVCRVASDKAATGLALLQDAGPGVLVRGSDTEVVLDGEVFGEPADDAAARGVLLRLNGRTHEAVSTGSPHGRAAGARAGVSVVAAGPAPRR